MKLSVVLVVFWCCLLHTPCMASGADVAKGKRIYVQYCTPCHGSQGNGHGLRAEKEILQPPPRDHTNGFYMNRQRDVRLFKVIKFGGAANHLSHVMPQWKHILSDEQISDIIAYIRTLAQDPPYKKPAVRNWGENPYAADEQQELEDVLRKK